MNTSPYLSLLNEFCKETIQYHDQIEIAGPFLPHGLEGYSDAHQKTFFIGRDTYGWSSINDLYNHFQNGTLETYIENNNAWPTVNQALDYANNKSGGFFTMAIRIQLLLNGITEYIRINKTLPEEYHPYINMMGWGNAHALETPESLKTEKIWTNLDRGVYKAIRNASRRFNQLKYIFDFLQPERVFILYGGLDFEDCFQGLEYSEVVDCGIDKVLQVFFFKEYSATVY